MLIAQCRQSIIFKTDSKHLKLISQLYDGCQETFFHYCDFLTQARSQSSTHSFIHSFIHSFEFLPRMYLPNRLEKRKKFEKELKSVSGEGDAIEAALADIEATIEDDEAVIQRSACAASVWTTRMGTLRPRRAPAHCSPLRSLRAGAHPLPLSLSLSHSQRSLS